MSGWDCAPDLLSNAQEPQLQGSLLASVEVGRSHSEQLDDCHPFPGHTHSSIPVSWYSESWLLAASWPCLPSASRMPSPLSSPHIPDLIRADPAQLVSLSEAFFSLGSARTDLHAFGELS